MKHNESVVVGKQQCPRCAKNGRDTRGDNLAVYSDGHKYCYGCGYYVSATKYTYVPPTRENSPENYFYIPDDSCGDFPYSILEWLTKKCKLTMEDIISNHLLWSPKYQWLIFPIEINGESVGFQARNFNTLKPYKWYTKFPKNGIVKLFPRKADYSRGEYQHEHRLCITEDIISAIQVSKVMDAMPLFGAFISNEMLLRVNRLGYETLYFWLDEDKFKEGTQFAKRARELGMGAFTICTPKDPKEYTKTEIMEILK